MTECAQKVIAGINQILDFNRLGINRIPAKPVGTPGTANFLNRNAGISTTLFLPSKPFGCAIGDNVNVSRANFSPILLHRYYESDFSKGNNNVNLLWLKPADVNLAYRRNMSLPFDGNTVPVSYDNYRINFIGVPTTLNIDKINPYIGYKLNVPALTPLEASRPDGLPLLFSDISGTNSIRGTLSLTFPTTHPTDLITWKEVVSVSKVNICEGETLTLTAQGSYESYAWYEGQNLKGSARTLDITVAGTYTLVVTGVGGCPASSYIVVEKNCDNTICNLQDINSLNTKQNSTWILGSKGGINFNTPTPSVFKEGANLLAREGLSTISDGNGDLLFYTDGQTIWNKTHVDVTTGLFNSSAQKALIIPNPSNFISNSYYVFGNQNGSLYYSLVGSDGLIINNKKNVLVHANPLPNPTISQKITATHHYNGQDIWLICHSTTPTRRIITYKVTPYGISPSSNSFNYSSTLMNSATGLLKVSPNGNYLVNTVANGIEVFNFSSSGSPSLKFGQGLNNISGVEFSPSSNLLYVTTSNGGLYQYNLAIVPGISRAPIVAPSPSSAISFGAMHLALDGQIYINRRNNTWLAKIQSPNNIANPTQIASLNQIAIQYQADGLNISSLGSTNLNATFGLQNQLTSYYPCQLFELSYTKPVNNYVISSNMGAGTASNGISYKWYKDGILLSASSAYAFSAGNSVLTTPNTGLYTVVIEVNCICYNSRDILIKDTPRPPCVDTKPFATDPTICGTTQTFQLFFDSEFCLFSPHQWDLIAANGTIILPTNMKVLTSFSTLNLGSNCSIELSIQNVPTDYTHLYLQNRNGTCKIPVTINFINRSAAITVTPKLDCSGYVLSASIAGRYSWSGVEPTTIPTGVITDEQNLEVGINGGTYQVDVINEGCTTRLTKKVDPILTIKRKIVQQYICVPAVLATTTTPAIPAYTTMKLTIVNDVTGGVEVPGDNYYWNITGNANESSIIVKDEFEYQAMVTNNNSCPVFLRHEVKFPRLAVTSIPNSDCSKYFITATPGFDPYTWKNPAGVVIAGNTTNRLDLIANSSSYGTYTVTGSLVAGSTCTETVSVTIEPNKIITSVPAGFGNIDNVLSVSASTFSHQWLRTQSTSIVSESGWGNGGLGTWRPQATFQYIKNRKREGITNGDGTKVDPIIAPATSLMPFITPNLKTDGVFSLNMFNWKSNGIAICDSWLKTQHITQYDRLGQEIENKDILNRHTAALYGYKGFLPVATAGNAKVDEIAFESFEEYTAETPVTVDDLSQNNMDLTTTSSTNPITSYQWLSTNDASFDAIPVPRVPATPWTGTYVAWIDTKVLTAGTLSGTKIFVKGSSLNLNNAGVFQGQPTSVLVTYHGNRTKLTFTMDASFTINGSPVLSTDQFYWNGEIGIEQQKTLAVTLSNPATITKKHKHTGKQSILFTTTTGLVFAKFTPQRLNPIAGRKYIVSAWVKLANSVEVNSQPRMLDYANINLVAGATGYRSNAIEGWVRIEQEVAVVGGKITLEFSKGATNTFDELYVDDIRIHPADAAIQTYVYDAKNYKLRATLDGNNFASLYFYDEQGNLYLTKKETERGIQTIQESLSHQPKTK